MSEEKKNKGGRPKLDRPHVDNLTERAYDVKIVESEKGKRTYYLVTVGYDPVSGKGAVLEEKYISDLEARAVREIQMVTTNKIMKKK